MLLARPQQDLKVRDNEVRRPNVLEREVLLFLPESFRGCSPDQEFCPSDRVRSVTAVRPTLETGDENPTLRQREENACFIRLRSLSLCPATTRSMRLFLKRPVLAVFFVAQKCIKADGLSKAWPCIKLLVCVFGYSITY